MGVPQKLNDADLQDFYDVYSDAVIHLLSVASNEDLSHMIPHCKNKHAMCTQWAIAGSCHNNGVHNVSRRRICQFFPCVYHSHSLLLLRGLLLLFRKEYFMDTE